MEIAGCALAFAGACYRGAEVIASIITNYREAPKFISSLQKNCKEMQRTLGELNNVLGRGPMARPSDEQRALLRLYQRDQAEFATRLQEYQTELRKYIRSENSRIANFVPWDRLRVVWRRQYLNDMRSAFLESRSSIQFLLIALQVSVNSLGLFIRGWANHRP